MIHTVPRSFEIPVKASQARSQAQEILDKKRIKALRLGTGRKAKQRIVRMLVDAENDLVRRIAAMPRSDSWSRDDAIAMLAQVRDTLGHMSPRFADLLAQNDAMARALGAKDTLDLLVQFEGKRPYLTRPLSLSQVESAANELTMIRYQSTVQRYGAIMIDSIQRELLAKAVTGATFYEITEGIRRNVGGPDGLFLSRRYFAERIVRTECMASYNDGHMQEIHLQRSKHFPDLKKKLIETFDARTAKDSYFAHGQVRELNDVFTDGAGRRYQRPPGRPNDRAVVISWRDAWTEENDPLSQLDNPLQAYEKAQEPYKKTATAATQPTITQTQPTITQAQQITEKPRQDAAAMFKKYAYQPIADVAKRAEFVFGSNMPTPEQFEAMFSGSNIKAKLTSVSLDKNGGLSVDCALMKGKKEIGNTTRIFRKEEGTLTVKHDVLTIDKKHQGTGYAGEALKNSIAAYKQIGVQSVDLRAEQIGRYVWASFGWQWDEKTAERMAKKLEKFLEAKGMASQGAKEIARHPWTVADLTTPNGERIGKQFLLEKVEGWHGTLRLSNEDQGFQRFLSKIQPKDSSN